MRLFLLVRVVMVLMAAAAAGVARGDEPGAPPPVPPPVAAPARPLVLLHLTSDNPAAGLFRIDALANSYAYSSRHFAAMPLEILSQVCQTPCNQVTDAGAVYRVMGPGIMPSGAFVLPPSTGELRLDVHAGSMGGLIGGASLAVLGGFGTIAGGFLLMFGTVMDANHAASGSPPPQSGRDLQIGGAITLGVGVALLAGGIVLWTRNVTRVHDAAGKPLGTLQLGRGMYVTPAGGLVF